MLKYKYITEAEVTKEKPSNGPIRANENKADGRID